MESGNRKCVNTVQCGFPFLSSGRSFTNDVEFSGFIHKYECLPCYIRSVHAASFLARFWVLILCH